ncbi:MAG: hypothetical protein EZS28_029667 [Streblomastix strix]|uniref:Uncharacterized protein n=1 Tax=Streblomastix strix TaxID=222440 RepID=A0A5J4UYG0_9EUKA|nr:MAG: hypothetical protein EZS28_029667 [Streblomastix strix]
MAFIASESNLEIVCRFLLYPNRRKVSARKKRPFCKVLEVRIDELLSGQVAEVDSWDIANKFGKLTENTLSNLVSKVINKLKKGDILNIHSNTIEEICHVGDLLFQGQIMTMKGKRRKNTQRLDEAQENAMLAYAILERIDGKAIQMAESLSMVKNLLDIEVSKKWLRYFALLHSEEMPIVKYEPGEYGRMRVEEADI